MSGTRLRSSVVLLALVACANLNSNPYLTVLIDLRAGIPTLAYATSEG